MVKNIKIILELINKFFYESGSYIIYTYADNPDSNYYNDTEIKLFSKPSEIPDFIKKGLITIPFINPLFYRLKLKRAILLTLYNDTEIIAYGWIQNWQPFRRKFGWLYKEATMLGPYWTNNSYRGMGYYGKLLRQSIFLASKEFPVFIYTTPDNVNSQKGIEKIGFKEIGTFRIDLWFRFFARHKKIS